MNIIKYLRRRKIRKLAEKIIASQTVYHQEDIKEERVTNAIKTAEKFYEIWEEY